MLMISEVLSQRSLTGNKTKFPDLSSPFSLKNKLCEIRSAQDGRRFIVLINCIFFPIPFSPESPCAQKSCIQYLAGYIQWKPGENGCRGMCQGQGWMSEGRKQCSFVAGGCCFAHQTGIINTASIMVTYSLGNTHSRCSLFGSATTIADAEPQRLCTVIKVNWIELD